MQARSYCRLVARSGDDVDDVLPPTGRRHQEWGRGTRTNWATVHYWIETHANQSWDEIFSEISRKYDERRGRDRLLIDAVKSMLLDKWPTRLSSRQKGPYLDADGILRVPERRWRPIVRRVPWKQLKDWTKGRGVIDYGTVQFWTVPAPGEGRIRCRYRLVCGRVHEVVRERVEVSKEVWQSLHFSEKAYHRPKEPYYRVVTTHYCMALKRLAQGERMTDEEMAYWRALCPADRNQLVMWSHRLLRETKAETF
jgi:hypothetical protein